MFRENWTVLSLSSGCVKLSRKGCLVKFIFISFDLFKEK